jgi:threonine dehydrogenase-like Zn-dependent dehydrogenase
MANDCGDCKLRAYVRADEPLPAQYWLWPLYGQELENLGRDGQPIQTPMPECGPDQLLVRHDAVGLCFSDTKVIHAGESHPRLHGRDMKHDPVVLGHEVALTVMQVGANRADRFKVGDRFIIQADILYKGVGLAYGYALRGGLQQYNLIGPEVLDGDDGCYLLPLKDATGYAQAALTEPWACVTASYDVTYRTAWQPGGATLIVAGPGALAHYTLGAPYAGAQAPAVVVTLGVTGALAEELARRAASDGFALAALGAVSDETLRQALEAAPKGGFDDVVLLGADVTLYERLEPLARRGALLNIVGGQAIEGLARVDVGRLHYEHINFIGTETTDIGAAYRPIRAQLKPGGCAAFLGAAGPMGQMHFQRALQLQDAPRLLVATDLVTERLQELETKYAELIASRRGEVEAVFRVPAQGQSPAEFNAGLLALTGGAGFDDIVVLAPSAGVVTGAVKMLTSGGLLNVFAGLPSGTKAAIDLRDLLSKQLSFTGTSGSSIHDLRSMLDLAEAGELNPNLSVVAVSGFSGAREGLDGVMNQRYPGKVVIYPQALDFPVTPLADLKAVLPTVYAKLGPNESWTVEAEREFLKELLP